MKTLVEKEVEHLIIGSAILGTGGGGDPEEGLNILKNDLKKGRKLTIARLEEASDDSLIVCPYFCGSIAPAKRKHKTVVFKDPMVVAFKRMEKYLEKKISATVAVELGGINTAISLHVASTMGLPLIDGDYIGRAAPEIQQSSANIFDVPLLPCVAVSDVGDVIIIDRYADLDEYEEMVRSLSVVAGGLAVVDTPISGSVAKKVIIKDTVSKCMEVGKVVAEANIAERDPIPKLVRCLNGVPIFKGVVKKYEWEDRGGFLYGEAIYEGVEKWEGHKLKIWVKNENIIAWRDGKVVVTAPDAIYVVDEKGYAITNAELKEGVTAVVIGAEAPKVWHTSKGIELFGPRHFGFQFDYKPIKNSLCAGGKK